MKDRKTLVKTCVALSLALGALATGRTAHATDPKNMLAPAATIADAPSNPLVAVAHNGNVCLAYMASSSKWTCLAPPSGVTLAAGPSITSMPTQHPPSGIGITWVFVIMLGSDGNVYETHRGANGTTAGWFPWGKTWFGKFPAGTKLTSAVVAQHGNSAISLAVRDSNNRVWTNLAYANADDSIPYFIGWTQAPSTTAITSAPAPALTDFNQFLFALGPNNTVRYSTCGFPTCYDSWIDVPNTTKTFNESPSAYGYMNAGEPLVKIAGTSNGHVWAGTMNMSGKTFSGFTDYGAAAGTAADSAPAVVNYGSHFILIVHANNGKYMFRDITTGTTWGPIAPVF